MILNCNFPNFAKLTGKNKLKYIFLSVEIDLVEDGVNELDVGDEKVDELNLTDFRFDKDKVLILYLIDDPFFVLPTYHKCYSIGYLRTHMYFSLVM
mgnify:CR=1 FL=1